MKQNPFLCLDCHIDTAEIGEYPVMLMNNLWHSIVPDGQGMLCIGCLEVRLGRRLVRTDFLFTKPRMPYQSRRWKARLKAI